jgi:hypothetical protein
MFYLFFRYLASVEVECTEEERRKMEDDRKLEDARVKREEEERNPIPYQSHGGVGCQQHDIN